MGCSQRAPLCASRLTLFSCTRGARTGGTGGLLGAMVWWEQWFAGSDGLLGMIVCWEWWFVGSDGLLGVRARWRDTSPRQPFLCGGIGMKIHSRPRNKALSCDAPPAPWASPASPQPSAYFLGGCAAIRDELTPVGLGARVGGGTAGLFLPIPALQAKVASPGDGVTLGGHTQHPPAPAPRDDREQARVPAPSPLGSLPFISC